MFTFTIKRKKKDRTLLSSLKKKTLLSLKCGPISRILIGINAKRQLKQLET